jgi:hypothetical protein
MPPVGFESTISAGERPQTHALDRVATGTGVILISELERNWRDGLAVSGGTDKGHEGPDSQYPIFRRILEPETSQ